LWKNTWIEITIFLQWSPLVKEISITMVMAMDMEDMGDGMDELWWRISFGVVYMDLMDGGSAW
jgi:hypothetical protein